jgi:RNA polymerase sigma-70 factor (ECF subfamily)
MGVLKYTEQEFRKKYDTYSNMIYKLCIVHMGNQADAEDLVQEIFLKMLYHAPKFESLEHEKHWLIRVTINACKDYFKGFWKKNVISVEEIKDQTISEEQYSLLEDIVKLPGKYKDVIHLYYYEEYSVSEIAKILKLGESAVKMRLKRGREMLKAEITDSERMLENG